MKKYSWAEIRSNALEMIMIFAGAVIAAFAIEEFLSPNRIFDGGVTGISMILVAKLPVSLSLFVILLNIPFFIVASKKIGKVFLIKSLIAIVTFSVSIGLFEHMQQITRDSLLATVFGGIVLGIGVGLVLRGGGCLDGTEVVGILISRKTSFSVGRVVLLINVVIYFAAGLVFGIDSGMYSMLMYFITSKVIDIVERGLEQAKAVMIVTAEGELLAQEIYDRLGRTATLMPGRGLVSDKEMDVIYCVITRAEISEIRAIVRSMKDSSFTTISDVSEIIGTHIKKVQIEDETSKDEPSDDEQSNDEPSNDAQTSEQ